jgi:ABC-type transport system involved in cytochrome bd biosynthesis fused ATPase/permease subunit
MSSDEIFVMADGQIAEHGTAQELIDQQGIFAELIRAQQAGEGVEKDEESESLSEINTVS